MGQQEQQRAQHAPEPRWVALDGRTFVVIRGKSVSEITGPDSRRPIYGALRQAVIAKATGSAA